MELYKTYVRENGSSVKRAEELARFGTLVLPKGPLGEVATEGSYAVLGLIGVINDAIIHGKTKRAGEAWSFAGGQQQYQIRVTMVRSLLTFFAHAEALLEVSATKWATTQARDRLIIAIEVIKALARLLLLKWFPRECIYAGGKFESFVPTTAEGGGSEVAPATPTTTWTGRRSRVALKVSQSVQRYVNPAGANETLNREIRMRVAAEVLHIARPVVFVVLSRRYKDRWWPFLLSLAMDLTSLKLFQTAAKIPSVTPSVLPTANVSSHDVTEFRRRTLLLLFYFFRTPLYENTLGAFASSLVQSSENVTGLSTIAELIAFQFDFYHNTHFYSAAS